jgi:anti-sigma regulatory factor (Ser/Thr protein kinase)
MRHILFVGPFPWDDLKVAASDWPDCQVSESVGEAGALRMLRARAFDVFVTNPATPARKDLSVAHEARVLQPGLRTIVLAPALTPADIITALRDDVFASFSLPIEPEELRTTISEALNESGWRNGIDVLSAVPHWIALRVSCRRVTADRLTRFMAELAGDLEESERFNLITAFREILLNAMEHGAGFDEEKVVDVSAVRTERAIVYYFKDPGPGFNPAAPPGAVATSDDPLSHMLEREEQGVRPGGFGLLLTRKLVDEVHYNETGNEVILVKHLT